jgi:hypothetical protein
MEVKSVNAEPKIIQHSLKICQRMAPLIVPTGFTENKTYRAKASENQTPEVVT